MGKRLLALFKALLADETKRLDDPERLLDNAQKEMLQTQALHRERAIEAVTAKNNLQQSVNEMRKRIEKLTEKADEAERSDDKEKAQNLRLKRDDCEETLLMMEQRLARAMELCEQVKDAIRREEEKVQQKTREALEMKAQWRDSQMPRANSAPPNVWVLFIAVALWVLLILLLAYLARLIWR